MNQNASLLKILGFLLCVLAPIINAQEDSPLWRGLFTEQQVDQGQQAYITHCASCHANDLRGNSNSPGLVGVGFMFLWEGKPLVELYQQMRQNMPTDRPASLPVSSYENILAFLLARNGFPTGERALTESVLQRQEIPITAPP